MPLNHMSQLDYAPKKRRRLHIWKLSAILLLLINIVIILGWFISAHALTTTRNEQRAAFGQQYSYVVEQLKSLISQNINEASIPEDNRQQMLSSIALLQYSGEQLAEHLNKRDAAKLNMMVVVLNSLQQAIQNKQFQNYCHLSDQDTVKGLHGYVYLLDQLPNNGDHDNGKELFNSILQGWPYRSINELYSSCSLKQS